MTERKVRFAIYGCGLIAGVHAEALLGLDEAELIGCADVNPASAVRFAEKYGIRAYESFDALLCDACVDAVCLCTPSGTHAELAIAALKKDKNVVTEKPMATTVADCERMILAEERSKGRLTVISQLRTSPDVKRAREIIASGALGKLVLCDLYMKYHRDASYYHGTWKGTRHMDGGGALLNQGIHGVDVLLYLVGMPKQVKSMVRTLVHDIEVEDTAVALLELENGAVGVIEATTSVNPGYDRRIEIHGSRGTLTLSENTIVSLIVDGEQRVTEESAVSSRGRDDPSVIGIEEHRSQLGNFVAALLHGEELLVDSRSGSLAVRVIEKIYDQDKESKGR